MGRNRFKRLCGTAVICAMLAGCYQDTVSIDMPQRGNTFTLSPQLVREVTVKSNSDFQDNIINGDVYVIQVDASGNVMTGSNGSLLVTAITPAASGDNLYSVTLNNLTTPSKIYFMANTGNPLSGMTAATEEDIKAASRNINSEDGIIQNGVPMVGIWEEGDFTEIPMVPSVVKVVFTLQTDLETNQEFALQSVQLKQVPNTLYYYRDDNDAPRYATADVIDYALGPNCGLDYSNEAEYNLSDWGEHWLSGVTRTGKPMTTPETCTWYVPENAQGESSGVTDQWDKNAENAPEGRGAYCTYIEIIGYYKYDGLINEVTYQVFLGENATNNYSLIRGTQYNVTATIKGQHTIDTRITPVVPQNYIDYTDNRMPWFVMNPQNLSSITYDQNFDNIAGFPVSWSIPSKKDMMLAWIYQSNIINNFSGYYWVNEMVDENNQEATLANIASRWAIDMGSGQTITMSMAQDGTSLRGSLIPTKDISGFQYPYVRQENGRDIIVSRDAEGGVEENRLRTRTFESSHDELSSSNAIPAQFEISSYPVDNNDRVKKTWADAQTYCAELNEDGGGWRMPTQRELMLMYILNDQLTKKLMTSPSEVKDNEGDMSGNGEETGKHIFYWSGTTDSQSNNEGWSVCFCTDEYGKEGKTEGYPKTELNFVRCVRDIK